MSSLLFIQGTLKSLLQHHSLKASILQHSAFFTDQLSHPYMTTEKTIGLTIQTFVIYLYLSILILEGRCYYPNRSCRDEVTWSGHILRGGRDSFQTQVALTHKKFLSQQTTLSPLPYEVELKCLDFFFFLHSLAPPRGQKRCLTPYNPKEASRDKFS